jgi:hypothetical protein
MMSFTPNVFYGNPQPSYAYNAYTVVVEAAIYRKINGVPVKVSASQRNLPIYIVNNPANANPEIINVTANGQPVQPNEIIRIRSGSALNFQFNTADANGGDSLKLILPDPQFSGFPSNTTTSSTTGIWPSGTLTFNTIAAATDQLIYFPVMVMDNACPVRGVTTQVYGIKMLANTTGQKEMFTTNFNFSAFPNPFSERVTFSISHHGQPASIIIYNVLGQKIDEISIPKTSDEEQSVQWYNSNKYIAGTYVAKLLSGDKTIKTLKFTKLQ